ncbi:PEP-utilizing enzyme [Micromonospora tulbaghiae]|uniref:PEP-utilizing enzyme n=1 Tax=Micromonospora tulbaghiae TaxID=479978 RepID=UPI0033EC3CEE
MRVVNGPAEFGRVQPGDVLACRTTDPAWTPLLGVAAAIVTEIDGLLSQAAIVARCVTVRRWRWTGAGRVVLVDSWSAGRRPASEEIAPESLRPLAPATPRAAFTDPRGRGVRRSAP